MHTIVTHCQRSNDLWIVLISVIALHKITARKVAQIKVRAVAFLNQGMYHAEDRALMLYGRLNDRSMIGGRVRRNRYPLSWGSSLSGTIDADPAMLASMKRLGEFNIPQQRSLARTHRESAMRITFGDCSRQIRTLAHDSSRDLDWRDGAERKRAISELRRAPTIFLVSQPKVFAECAQEFIQFFGNSTETREINALRALPEMYTKSNLGHFSGALI